MRKSFANVLLLTAMLMLSVMPATAKEAVKPSAKDDLKIVDVDQAFATPLDYAGKVGLRGAVVEVADKDYSFVILNPNAAKSCTTCADGCADVKKLTVRVPKANFKGKLPKVGDRLVVVGELEPLTVGFEFSPTEVRNGKKVILAKAK